MTARIGLGVIGVGRRWRRYAAALSTLGHMVRVRAVSDPSLQRARDAAGGVGAAAVDGMLELIRHPAVEAILLPGGSWFGLWPIEHALTLNKPVLCTVVPPNELSLLTRLRSQFGDQARITFAPWPALSLMREVISEQLNETLGMARLVQATATTRSPALAARAAWWQRRALALLQVCVDLLTVAPSKLTLHTSGNLGLVTLLGEHGEAGAAQLTLLPRGARASCRLHVEAERGTLDAELPHQLTWVDMGGRQTRTLPAMPGEVLVLERFLRSVRAGGQGNVPEVCSALGWLRGLMGGG